MNEDHETRAIQYWIALSEDRVFDARDIKEQLCIELTPYVAIQYIEQARIVANTTGLFPENKEPNINEWARLKQRRLHI